MFLCLLFLCVHRGCSADRPLGWAPLKVAPGSQDMFQGPWWDMGTEETTLSETRLSQTSPLTFGKVSPSLGPSVGRAQRGPGGLRILMAPVPAAVASLNVLGEAGGRS